MQKAIKRYLLVYLIFHFIFNLILWVFFDNIYALGWSKDAREFWLPLLLIYGVSFLLMRPVLKKSPVKPGSRSALLSVIVPLSIWVPLLFSQDYFTDLRSPLIHIQHPDQAVLYPQERFFSIKEYTIKPEEFSLYKLKRYKSGKSKSIELNCFYVAPLYNDSVTNECKVACGIRFSKRINNGYFSKDKVPARTASFYEETSELFAGYDYGNISFFEKTIDLEEEEAFSFAWSKNELLKTKGPPFVLIPVAESLNSRLSRKLIHLLIALSLGIGICIMLMIYSARYNFGK